jgi:hypothetical protein
VQLSGRERRHSTQLWSSGSQKRFVLGQACVSQSMHATQCWFASHSGLSLGQARASLLVHSTQRCWLISHMGLLLGQAGVSLSVHSMQW